MGKETDRRKKLLNGKSQLEAFAREFYIDRFSKVSNGWGWESKIKWGLPPQDSKEN